MTKQEILNLVEKLRKQAGLDEEAVWRPLNEDITTRDPNWRFIENKDSNEFYYNNVSKRMFIMSRNRYYIEFVISDRQKRLIESKGGLQ